MTLSLLQVNNGASTFPMFNGSADQWNHFKISLHNHFSITGMNMNLISLDNSSFTDKKNAISWAYLKPSFWNLPVERYVYLFTDDGIALFKHLKKELEKHGLDKVYELRHKFNTCGLKALLIHPTICWSFNMSGASSIIWVR